MNHPTIIVFYLPFHSKGPGSCQSMLRNLTAKQGHVWGCRENASRKNVAVGEGRSAGEVPCGQPLL